MTRLYSPIYLVAALLCCARISSAQELQTRDESLQIELMSDAAGIPMGGVLGIAQDALGYMWFGMSTGLCRYDGYACKIYRHDPFDPTSLSTNDIETVYVDRSGTLWIGTNGGGLNRYDPLTDSFTRYEYDPADPSSLYDPPISGLTRNGQIKAIFEDHTRTLWIGSGSGGLNRFDREAGTFTHYTEEDGLSHIAVRSIFEDREGVLWIGTGDPFDRTPELGGLNRYDRKTDTFRQYVHDPADEHSLIDNRVTTLYEDNAGILWVGTWGDGLHRYDRGQDRFTRFSYDADHTEIPHSPRLRLSRYATGSAGTGIKFIHEDRFGDFWIGAFNGGIDRYDRGTGSVIHYEFDPSVAGGLTTNQIWTMYESHDGTLWIGAWGALFKVVRRPFQRYMNEPGNPNSLSSNLINVLFEDDAGTLWIGTLDGLNAWDRANGSITHYWNDNEDPTSLSSNRIRSIAADQDGTIWVGTGDGGLNRFDASTGRFKRFEHDPEDTLSLNAGAVSLIYCDTRGRLWVATAGTGLNRFHEESNTFTRYRVVPVDPSISDRTYFGLANTVNDIYEDKAGSFWIGTGEGFVRFDPEHETFESYIGEAMLLRGSLRDIYYEDTNERIWLGTREGLMRFDPESGRISERFTLQDGPGASNSVNAIVGGEAGRLWISGGNGISRFDPVTNEFMHFGTAHGIEGRTLVVGEGSAIRSRSGELFFGSRAGLYAFFPEQVVPNRYPPDVFLEGLRIYGEPLKPEPDSPLKTLLPYTEAIELTHHQNDLTFSYVGLHYQHPSMNLYRYRLEPYDGNWIDAGMQRQARYTNLSPGIYTFHVEASNSDGVWSEDSASMQITIIPPLWRTTWAYTFYGLLIAAGIFAVDRIQRRRLIRKERKQAMVRDLEQTRRIEAMNQQLQEHKQQLETQNAQLERQKQRLVELDAVKSRFFANISHEFRTPLTLLLGPLDDALRQSDLAEGLRFPRRQVAAMRRNGLRLLWLIDQLLDLSRLESGRMPLRARRADLIRFIRNIVSAFAYRAERDHITLQFAASSRALYMYYDPDKLEKIVTNLLSNAFKFTPSHGKICINVEQVAGEAGAFAEIVVRDTGQGIPPDALPHIFDRFHQVDASATRLRGGAGIGLALVKELVERHGGAIDVESQLGFGTTFFVCLPLGKEHLDPDDVVEEESEETTPEVAWLDDAPFYIEEDSQPATADRTNPHAGAPTILVVEDNEDMRSYLRSLLAARYHVVEAGDGIVGLEMAREVGPALILSDVMMPGMDGYALCEAVKSDAGLSDIPVVLLTARASEENKLEGLVLGADDYLYKPFSAAELLLRMENLIEMRRHLRRRFSEEVLIGPGAISAPSAEAEFLKRVQVIVEEHMADTNFGVDWLAQEIGLSRRHMSRKLDRLTSLSAAGYIRMMRLERAAQLLEHQAGTVSEIGYRVGFNSPSHFSRLFNQVFGIPPSQYPSEQNPPI